MNNENNFIFCSIDIYLSNNCSFDNKSGIWKNENINYKKKKRFFKDFENIIE